MGSSIDLYTAHFGLTARPFSLVPDPDFLFWSDTHARAFSMLEYGILTRAPITLITGEVGTGKTTLIHQLISAQRDDVTIGLVANAHGDRSELLRWVLLSLGQPVDHDAHYVDMYGQFQTYLVAEYAAGRRVVLIFDEAQNLTRDVLEELRMFTNINAGKDELLQLIIVGQPELRDVVLRADLKQFAQRVAASFHLPEMEAAGVEEYITHRLTIAGRTDPIFDAGALAAIYEATRGIPRLVNQLCDLALVYAFTMDRQDVDVAIIKQVLKDGVFFGGGFSAAPPSFRRARMTEAS
ncbi:MAG: AAA family ATPase [Pseudomonadota bacterium]